jgi:hypothetical protein
MATKWLILFELGDVPQQSNYVKDLTLVLDKLQQLTAWFNQLHNQSK